MVAWDVIGAFVTLAGSVFLLLGALGVACMPDLYNRMQAGTKATTLGTILSLAGVALLRPEWGLKLLLIGFFLFEKRETVRVRDLIVVGVDLGEGQKAVPVAAVVNEGGLQRRFVF